MLKSALDINDYCLQYLCEMTIIPENDFDSYIEKGYEQQKKQIEYVEQMVSPAQQSNNINNDIWQPLDVYKNLWKI